MLSDTRLNVAIIISIFGHVLIYLLLSRAGRFSPLSYEDIKEITFIDQSYRPEVAKVVSKGSIWGETKEDVGDAASSSYGAEIVTPAIDLNAKLDRSQAEIDLDRYLTNDEAGEVIKIGNRANGTVKSTAEILAEKPISLAKNLPRGAGTEGGTGVGGKIGVKAEAPVLRIDKDSPPLTQPRVDKEITAPPATNLDVTKGETQILVAGPIANRAILYKALPKYPSWCLNKGISGVVKLRLWVEASGNVREGVLVEVSSGYPDLDQSVVDALKKWRFAPLPANVVQETQWGVITFRFICG